MSNPLADLMTHPLAQLNIHRAVAVLVKQGKLPEINASNREVFLAGASLAAPLLMLGLTAAARSDGKPDPETPDPFFASAFSAPLVDMLIEYQKLQAAGTLELPRDVAADPEKAGAMGKLGQVLEYTRTISQHMPPAREMVSVLMGMDAFHGGVRAPRGFSLDDLIGTPMNFMDAPEAHEQDRPVTQQDRIAPPPPMARAEDLPGGAWWV